MKALSILGPVDSESLGFTLVHEHLLANPPEVLSSKEPDLVMPSVEKAVEEVKLFAKAGGKTLVEASPMNYGRNVLGMVKIAESVPEVNIIAATGFYTALTLDEEFSKKTVDEVTDLMINEIESGMSRTSYRAGLIKVAVSYFNIHPLEEKALRAAARAHKETGAPIQVHMSYGTMGLEIVSIFKEEGADLRKVLLLHMDENLDLWLMKKVLETGVNISFDKFARVKYRIPEEKRINYLKELIDSGFLDQLMVSSDMGRRSYFKSYGGGPGLEYLPKVIVPRLREMGWDEEIIEKLFIENPKNYLSFLP